MNSIMSLFRNMAETVHEINLKYAKPRIALTPAVKFSLLALRIYLFLLVGLLIVKFFTALHG